jgi:hypothetical protein
MANQTKMIIITSNEDLIRQFSLNTNQNTHIIDLDNKQQMVPTTEDKSQLINLAFFAHLSELVRILYSINKSIVSIFIF